MRKTLVNLFGWSAGIVVGAVAVAMLWLFWPMPSQDVDWRAAAERYLAEEDCASFSFLFGAAPGSVVLEMNDHLGGRTLVEACPYKNSRADRIAEDQEFFDLALENRLWQKEEWGWRDWFGLGYFWQELRKGRGTRRRGFRFYTDYWLDVTIAARCSHWRNLDRSRMPVFSSAAEQPINWNYPYDTDLTRLYECIALNTRVINSADRLLRRKEWAMVWRESYTYSAEIVASGIPPNPNED